MAKTNSATELDFEDKFWKAADLLWGCIDVSDYKDVVLGLIFLKYISDCFDEKYDELVKEGKGVEEDKDEYSSCNIFFVPAEARWRKVAEAAHTPEIGKAIDDAMRLIEQENPQLKNILPKSFARPGLDKRRLGDVVDLFTDSIKRSSNDDSKDLLGRTYEYCLRKFAEKGGVNADEFYTPACVVRTIVEVIEPFKGRVYDPACGSGEMLVQSAKFINEHQGNLKNISIYGQDSDPTTWKMARMNLAIHGLEADLGKYHADTFIDDQHPTLKADFVMASPPFNLSNWGAGKLQEDVRWKYGIPPANDGSFAWLQHMIYHLSPVGRIGMVLANRPLLSQAREERTIRENIIKADLVEGIVALPDNLFYFSSLPVSLWFLSRDKAQKGKILFVDARNLGEMVSKRLRELTEDDIRKIANAFRSFREGSLMEEKGFCAVKTLGDVKEQDYNLTPGRYVGIAESKEDEEPFEEKMERLTSELRSLLEEGHRLEEEIKKLLGRIGVDL